MFRTIVKADSRNYVVRLMRIVQRRNRIHPTTDQNHNLFHLESVIWAVTPLGCSATTESESPPRAANLPSILIRRGLQALIRSSRMRLITSSLKEGTFRYEER